MQHTWGGVSPRGPVCASFGNNPHCIAFSQPTRGVPVTHYIIFAMSTSFPLFTQRSPSIQSLSTRLLTRPPPSTSLRETNLTPVPASFPSVSPGSHPGSVPKAQSHCQCGLWGCSPCYVWNVPGSCQEMTHTCCHLENLCWTLCRWQRNRHSGVTELRRQASALLVGVLFGHGIKDRLR